jgi:hypothetical protein
VQIFASLHVAFCRVAGRPYATEVASQVLCDTMDDRVVAHPFAIKFLQSLNGSGKMAHRRLNAFGIGGAVSAAADVDPVIAIRISVAFDILVSGDLPPDASNLRPRRIDFFVAASAPG